MFLWELYSRFLLSKKTDRPGFNAKMSTVRPDKRAHCQFHLIDRHTPTDKRTDRHTQKQTDKHTNRQTDIQGVFY